ncbi:Cathepsin B4 [Aphelenchoides besseyi]|nr:Cathepsin B4 [Aphelenchoides besseyi]KAI6236045.1 Cathepsin B4 [Aphelenchoides besseyi]
MMFRVLCLLAVLAALVYSDGRKLSDDELVEHINKQGKWQATKYERFAGKSKEELKQYLGALKKPTHMRRRAKPSNIEKLDDAPKSFSAIEAWPQCSSIIGLIQDQSSCGSCWAVSTTSALSDRLCIASNGTIQKSMSALDLMACCSDCGYQCQGGYPDSAWDYFTSTGVSTGNNYTDDGGCKPYPIAPCWIDKKTKKMKCPEEPTDSYTCKKACQASYTDEPYKKDHYYGSSTNYFSNENENAIADLVKNGPIVAAFDVYEDFYSYKSGIYQYTYGDYLGGHAVRVVGYGEENGVKFWTVANSWHDYWGENGYFRIIRGTNDCSFEEEMTSGNADVARSLKNK